MENDVTQHQCSGVRGANITNVTAARCLLLIVPLINWWLAFVLSEDAQACYLAQGNEINFSFTKQMYIKHYDQMKWAELYLLVCTGRRQEGEPQVFQW